MDQNEVKIRVAEEKISARTKPSKRIMTPWLLLGILLVPVLFEAVFYAYSHVSKTPSTNVARPENPHATEQTETVIDKEALTEEVVPVLTATAVPDDGESLWASPTDGETLDLRYMLPGTQLILHVRVAALLSHPEGEKVFAALGPWGEQVLQGVTDSTGVELTNVDSLLLGMRPTRTGPVEIALRLRVTEALSKSQLVDKCYLPKGADGRVVVACSPNAMAELKQQGDEPPLFARELHRVLQRADSDRMATLVFAGKFLQISGEKIVQGTGEPLRQALVDFLGDEATATAISAHWDESFFLELQSTVALHERPHRFAALLTERVAATSDQVEDAILEKSQHPYGRKVIARLPAMLRKLGNYTRAAEENGLSVVRSYLPVTAGHNLAMATELLLNMSMNSDVTVRAELAANAPATDESINEKLQRTTSLVFTKETLQKSLEMLSEDLNVPIEIAGRDLQLEGITKNQSFGIEMRDQPAEEILLAVMLRANPDRTASGPTDVKQKLVYVIRHSAADQPRAIVVTTRSAAERRGEKLPAVFVPAAR